jgi:hypothetical protein
LKVIWPHWHDLKVVDPKWPIREVDIGLSMDCAQEHGPKLGEHTVPIAWCCLAE